MVFYLEGREYRLSREEVEEVMEGIEPFRGMSSFVIVNGQKYPPGQVLYFSLRRQWIGLSLSDFRSETAKDILGRLGFDLIVDDRGASRSLQRPSSS